MEQAHDTAACGQDSPSTCKHAAATGHQAYMVRHWHAHDALAVCFWVQAVRQQRFLQRSVAPQFRPDTKCAGRRYCHEHSHQQEGCFCAHHRVTRVGCITSRKCQLDFDGRVTAVKSGDGKVSCAQDIWTNDVGCMSGVMGSHCLRTGQVGEGAVGPREGREHSGKRQRRHAYCQGPGAPQRPLHRPDTRF